MNPRRQRLFELIEEYDLAPRRLADLTRSSVATVTAWTRPESNAAARVIPEPALELLEMKLDRWQNVRVDPDLYAALGILSDVTGKGITELANDRIRAALMSEFDANKADENVVELVTKDQAER